MKTFHTFQKFIASCIVLCFCVQSFAINQIDGNWTEYGLTEEYDGYYVIATAEDLEEFRVLVNGGQSDVNGVLTDDIVFNESVLDENGDLRSDYETAELKRWLPISYYSGTFDGRNHMISGLFVSGRGAYVGFFRKITGGVQIKNLNIVDSYFEGDNVIGGICADSEREGIITISNCSVNAYVYAKADQAGGIYGGYEYGGVTVENCVNLGKVISKGGNVGGICSISNGKIIGCINKGIVRGNGDRVGGILGGYGGTISNCCNMGIVEGSEYVGGIAGKGSRIINSCNLGTVNGVTNVGGIAGSAYTLENVYNVGDVTANAGVVGGLAGTITNVSYAYNAGKISNNSSLSNVGGLCGECTGTMTYCYYDSEVCPFSAVNNSTYAGATDKTTSAMCSSTLLTGLSSDVWAAGTTNVSASIIPNDEEFATKIIGQYPQLKFLNIESFTPYARKIYYNIGTSSMPEWEPCKLIYSIQDLVKIAVYPTATFVLMNDITEFRNLSDGSLLETPVAEWIPIGIFKGKLFGRGKTISGLCKTSTTGNGGLFEEVSSALIKDLNVANCRFDGDTVGGITGKASGETSIINCNNYCDFDVSSAKYVGGICGCINNYVAGKEPITINKCNNYGSIKGKTSYGGGICGYVYSQLDVIECVNYGNIVSSTSGGGIIGYGYARYLDAGIIQECVNNGVISSKYAGGIAGEINIFTSINYCLNNGLITGQGRVGGIVGTESSGNNMTQCLNVASVETNATAGGICANIGALFARYNYYNSDNCSHGAISDEDNGNCKGKTTAELISGELPYGFSSDYWGIRPVEIKDMKKYYYYPYLKCYGADSAILAVVRDCHSVSMNFNGGTTTDSIISFYVETEQALLPTNVQKTGCTFDGWYDNSNYTSSPYTEVPLTETQPKNFYAKWIANNYSVSLSPNGGNINMGNVQSYTYGYGAWLPQDVTKAGNTFKGWYPIKTCDVVLESYSSSRLTTAAKIISVFGLSTNEALAVVDNIPSIIVSQIPLTEAITKKQAFLKDMLAQISFESLVLSDEEEKCDLYLESCGTHKVAVIKIIQKHLNLGLRDAKAFADAAPTTLLSQVPVATAQAMKADLDTLSDVVSSYQNWVGGNVVTAISSTDFGDKYFGAKWEANTYSVNLQVNGGINTNNIGEYTYGIGATLPDDSEISRTGYTFAGWYVNSNYDGVAVEKISTTDYGDKTYYAKWLVNSYDVTLEANDGTINSGILKSYIYGVGATLPTDVTKTGYTFKGWYDNPQCEGESILAIPANATGNKTYYANWVVNTYNVTFFTYEGVMGTDIDSYTFGKETVLPTDVTKSGYDFGGWYTNDSYSGVAIQSIASNETGDKMYYAKWNKKSYPVSVTFDKAMGSISGIDSYLHGDNAVLKAHADAGYEFAFWSCDDETVLEGKNVQDSTLTFVVTSPTELSATFKFKEIVYPAADFVIGTVKTETEIAPIDIATLFESSEGGEISYMVTSSSPNVLLPQIEDGKLYLATMGLQGKATITVTAKLANGNKSSLSAEAVVEYNCNIQVEPTIVNASCYGFSDGSISLSAENEYTYQWIGEDVTINKIENVKAGNYSVQITDERGCKSLETYTVSQPDEISVEIAEVVNPRCGVQSEIHLNAAGDYTYAWSNGSTEKDLIGAEIGDYSVVVTNPETGCSITLTQSLELTFQKPQISLVTVSKGTGKNLIVWVRENTDQIAYYTIYREGAQSKKYTAIGTVNYSEISVFQDDVAKPMTRQWSYKISATDVCGHETELSEAHTTLHLNEMESMHDGMAELIWQPYEGLDYNSFYIVRETKVNNYTFIDTVTTVPSTLTSYTAEVPPLGKSIFYVGVKLDKVIDPKQFMKAESGPFALALSNIAEAENMGNPDAVETMGNTVEVSVISHTIFVKNAANKTIDVYGINGCKIVSVNGLEINAIDVPHDGVYFVVVDGKATKVLVK